MQPIIRKEHIGKEDNEKNSEQDIFLQYDGVECTEDQMQKSDNWWRIKAPLLRSGCRIGRPGCGQSPSWCFKSGLLPPNGSSAVVGRPAEPLPPRPSSFSSSSCCLSSSLGRSLCCRPYTWPPLMELQKMSNFNAGVLIIFIKCSITKFIWFQKTFGTSTIILCSL